MKKQKKKYKFLHHRGLSTESLIAIGGSSTSSLQRSILRNKCVHFKLYHLHYIRTCVKLKRLSTLENVNHKKFRYSNEYL